MKKMKILAPLMASVAVISPIMVSLSSCGKVDYSELISEFKDKTISTFMDLTRTTHRSPFVEGECYNYIKTKMTDAGFDLPAGYDEWSQVTQVAAKIAAEKQYWKDSGVPEATIASAFAEYGNIWYDIPATKGMEDAPKIILHAHMDVSMAFSTTEDEKKWASARKDIINVTYDRDNERLHTDGKASLGADDGLGIAAMLTLAEMHTKLKHGEIRLLFTAGESEGVGLYASGADYLHNDQCHEGKEYDSDSRSTAKGPVRLGANSKKPFGEKGEYRYILSTSGIYKNFVYSSCGGIHQCEFNDSTLTFNKPHVEGETDWDKNEVPWDVNSNLGGYNLYTLAIDGLHGGQSAKYINSGYASALQMIMNMVFTSDYDCRLFKAVSNPGPFAIPSSAEVIFATKLTEQELSDKVSLIINSYKTAYPNESWDKFTCALSKHEDEEARDKYKYSLSPIQSRIITKLFAFDLIYGPIDWFDTEHTSVKTSCNFAKLNLEVNLDGEANKSRFQVYNVCRSADQPSLELFFKLSHGILIDACQYFYNGAPGADAWKEASSHMQHNDKPVWEKTQDNKMVKALSDGYNNLGIKSSTWDNHGWLEISCFIETYTEQEWDPPYMSCLGPEIRNSHEVDEEVWTDSLANCLGAIMFAIEHIKNY